MAIGILKSNTLVAVVEEVTEGVFVPVAAGSDFIEVLEDGMELSDAKELVERNILTPSIGNVAPRTSTKSVTGSFPVEWKAGGVEGAVPDYDVLLRSLLGPVSALATFTTDSVGTVNTLVATGHGAAVGDFLVIETAGEFHLAFVKVVTDADNLTFTPDAPNTIQSGVDISSSQKYAPVNDGQITFSSSVYWGDEILETALGCRANSMALEGFTTGQIPNLAFAFEGLDFDRVDGSAAFTPEFAPGLPPIVLGATLSVDGGSCVQLNDVTLSVEHTLAFLTTVCSLSGKIASRYSDRIITGTFNPYLDDTTTEFFDKFQADTLFEMTITLGIPSAVTGELIPGSNVGIYLPSVLITETPISDLEGLLINSISFNANTGVSGGNVEIFMGFS